jgi:hypothetical protein
MPSFDFRISYVTTALPGWEAPRALRGLTHIYYYSLIAANETYARRLNETYYLNGQIMPEDLTKKLNISEADQLFLEVRSLSPRLEGTISAGNDDIAIDASEAIEVIKRLRAEAAAKNIPDNEKRERVASEPEIRRKLLEPIEQAPIEVGLKRDLLAAIVLACVSLLADSIESFEFTRRREAA